MWTSPWSSEFGTWRAQSSGFLVGTCALSVPCVGGLTPLEDILSTTVVQAPGARRPPASELLELVLKNVTPHPRKWPSPQGGKISQ
jgi:hypothetical protein